MRFVLAHHTSTNMLEDSSCFKFGLPGCQPEHTTFFGWEALSGLDPMKSNYDRFRNGPANQIARVGFIR